MSSLPNINRAIRIFICYAHKDKGMMLELKKHLYVLRQKGIIHTWDDGAIIAGKEWESEIGEHLDSADIILLLVSADFIASDYIYGTELKRALERHETGEARVVPVILRSVPWQYAPFGKLRALPAEGKPVRRWSDKDEAYKNIAEGIVDIVQDLIAYREQTKKETQARTSIQ